METGRAVGYLVLKDGKKHYFDIVIPVDEEPTAGSTKFLTSDAIKAALDSKVELRKANAYVLVTDNQIVLKAGDQEDSLDANAIASLKCLYDADTVPTQNSVYMVTSGGVHAAFVSAMYPQVCAYRGTAIDLDAQRSSHTFSWFKLLVQNQSVNNVAYSSVLTSDSGKSIVYEDSMPSYIPEQADVIISVRYKSNKYYISLEGTFSPV